MSTESQTYELIKLIGTEKGKSVLIGFNHPYTLGVGYDHFVKALKFFKIEHKTSSFKGEVVVNDSKFYFRSFEDDLSLNKVRGIRFSSVFINELNQNIRGVLFSKVYQSY